MHVVDLKKLNALDYSEIYVVSLRSSLLLFCDRVSIIFSCCCFCWQSDCIQFAVICLFYCRCVFKFNLCSIVLYRW